MSRYVFKLPDLGEGTVDAEIVSWRVKPGDVVCEDDVIVEVMTEKAAVEVPAPVSGRVLSTTGSPGDSVPVGAELIVIETGAADAATEAAAPSAAPKPAAAEPAPAAASQSTAPQAVAPQSTAARAAPGQPAAAQSAASQPTGSASAPSQVMPERKPPARTTPPAREPGNGRGHNGSARGGRIATSPAIRRRAHEAGIDLTQLSGSGPNGRILRQDFEAFVSGRRESRSRPSGGQPATGRDEIQEIKVIGLRRLIAQRMSESKRNIPHFAYVEEVDVTELESLRTHLNGHLPQGAATLTYLPFLVSALVRVLGSFPQCNALYDAERGVIVRHSAVHVGIATQTPDGLKVPVVRHAGTLSLWELAAEIRRVSEAARTNKATREELSGSTITVTSLGRLGGIASTPIINSPEVGILGINRAVERPMVHAGAIAVRRMMNLSSSFDHRFVDGHDAAAMIKALKEHLEHPATIFI
ncbi:MAG: 2-oxo acid dehydrogenase subunit E2 [Sinobacteraceae bacterium]|nr:2-oxo acid dehydrogenase subunit E2 [Nevskiaceae bacterium]